MQPLIHYHYPNRLNLVLSLNELPNTGYSMIYSRLMKINKGVTNQYRFTIQNQDQKSVNLLSKTLQFDMIDRETGNIVITKFNASGTGIIGSLKIGGSGNDGVNIRSKYELPDGADRLRRNYGDDARSEIILDNNNDIILVDSSWV